MLLTMKQLKKMVPQAFMAVLVVAVLAGCRNGYEEHFLTDKAYREQVRRDFT